MGYNVVLIPDFKKELKQIAKKQRSVLADVNHLIEELSENPTIGTDLGQNFYKVRMSISGTNKGKSGGARVITYVFLDRDTVLLTKIYLKSEYDTVDIKLLTENLKDEGLI
jgi:mRNA-degrading endonuclease RelE of RelBE toxin-antitoxin system